MVPAVQCSGPISLELSTLSLNTVADNTSSSRLSLETSPGQRKACTSDRRSCITPAAEEVGNSMRSDASENDRTVQGSRGLPSSDGPRKEDLCQRCGSLPALLAASAVCSQKRCLRQEIAWSRQLAIRSNLLSLRADTPKELYCPARCDQ